MLYTKASHKGGHYSKGFHECNLQNEVHDCAGKKHTTGFGKHTNFVNDIFCHPKIIKRQILFTNNGA